MQSLSLSHIGINYSQVKVLENPGYDFVFKPPEPPYGYEGGLDDMDDQASTLFWIYFYVFLFFLF